MEVLLEAKTGYRAKYIHGTDAMATDALFDEIRSLPYEEAKERIMSLPGIGPKVADCILLFGFDKMEAFPVDVWMHRVMTKHFLRGRKKTPEQIASYARKKFGRDAGYIQQYLFYLARLEGKG